MRDSTFKNLRTGVLVALAATSAVACTVGAGVAIAQPVLPGSPGASALPRARPGLQRVHRERGER